MTIHPGLIKDATEILALLKARLDDREDEVIETLRQVADGELEMVETITEDEKAYAQKLFGFVAEVGPLNIWDAIAPRVPGLVSATQTDGRGGFGSVLAAAGIPLPGAGIDHRTLSRIAVLLMSYTFYEEFHVPQAETGVYDIVGSPFQKLKWVYRHWLNQLEIAESAELEEVFAQQSLDLPSRPHTKHLSVSCAGDLLAVDVLTPENTPHLFDAITDFYSTADIVSANLESTVDASSPVGRTQEPGQPARMNTSEAMFRKFRDEARINYFSTATNHAMDWGESGVLATLDVLRDYGALYSGTAASQAEQDDVLVVEINGIRVALLAYTFDLNGYAVPPDKPYLVNEVRFNDAAPAPNYAMVRRQVAAAKAKRANHVIAYVHWGWEFEMYPHLDTVEAAHDLVACGVDTVLGNHAHVSQPPQLIRRGGGKRPALVLYSFGNFVSYHPESRNSQLTYAIKFDVVMDDNDPDAYVANVRALPLYIANIEREDGTYDCRILKFFDVLADPGRYGLTPLAQSQLPHLHDVVWTKILSPLSSLPT